MLTGADQVGGLLRLFGLVCQFGRLFCLFCLTLHFFILRERQLHQQSMKNYGEEEKKKKKEEKEDTHAQLHTKWKRKNEGAKGKGNLHCGKSVASALAPFSCITNGGDGGGGGR